MGDVNRDGILDIVTGNRKDYGSGYMNGISVIIGKGDGIFEIPITFPLHSDFTTTDIALGNFNGDTYPDMAVVTSSPYNLYILLGNGDGTFSPGNIYTITTTIVNKSILIGNFNGDTHEDIAIVDADKDMNSDKILFFYGKGDGTFSAPMEMRTGSAYPTRDVTSGDFNSDGVTDMAITAWDSTMSEVVLLMGNGDGTFLYSKLLASGSDSRFTGVAPGDFNGDGHPDLFITRHWNRRLGFTILMGNGQGSFLEKIDHETGLESVSYWEGIIRVKDLNGDRRSDILIPRCCPYVPDNTVFKFIGKGDGTFEPPVEFNISGRSMNTGDFDKDGAEDIVTGMNDRVYILFARGDGTFIDRKEIHGAGSYQILSADFDGDNTTDLAMPEDGKGTLFSTILNRGNKSLKEPFQGTDSYWVGDGPISVKTWDLNNDGKLDLVTANELSGDVSILLNNGDGRLKTPAAYKVGKLPNSVAIEDLNGDTYPDIITTNYGSNDISVLLGKGDGTFQNQQIYAVGPNPKDLVVGDFNRDGKSDIAVTNFNSSSNHISILIGNGDGTFQPQRIHIIDGEMPSSIVKGDFNEDGFMDLAVLNYSLYSGGNDVYVSYITLLLGKGDGTFSNKVVYSLNWIWINALLSKDLNKDGKLDLIIVTDSTEGTIILLGDGNGEFLRKSVIESIDLVSLGDLNNDGEIDLLGAAGNDSLGIWLGKGDGTFKLTTSIGGLVSWWTMPSPPEIGDINGDGVSDIAVVDYERLSIISGNGDGRFPGVTVFNEKDYYANVHLAIADFNRDNNQDIVVSMYPSDWYNNSTGKTRLVFFYGTGNNTFTKGATIETEGYWGGRITAVDFNEDGLPDIALAHNDIDAVSIFLNRGDGTFENALSYPIQGSRGMIEIGDINKDEHLDIISHDLWVGPTTYSLSIHTGNGDGTFQYKQRISLGNSALPDVVLKDFNGDGFSDMAVSYYLINKVEVFINRGDGIFNTLVSYDIGSDTGYLIAEDFNGDGIIDLAASGLPLSLFIGNGDGTFKPAEDYGIENGRRMVSRDFNLDGRLDIAISSGRTDIMNTQLLLNILPPLHTPPSPPDRVTEKGGDGMVSITWNPSIETDVIGYNIYRSISAGGGYTKLNNAPITSLSYTDTTVVNPNNAFQKGIPV